MRSLLGETSVVDDPPAPIAEVHGGHHPLRHAHQHLVIGPWRVGNEMVQRLMLGPRTPWRHVSSHWLHALALQRRHQSGAVSAQACVAIGMSKSGAQVRHVPLKFDQFLHQDSPLA